jgi:GAF domain-containing protein
MSIPSRFQKEQALRRAGVFISPYPTRSGDKSVAPQDDADRTLVEAGTAWEQEIDRLYLQLLMAAPGHADAETPDHFVLTCEASGLAAALLELNLRVPHRYTAVYRLDGAMLRNVELADKLGEARPEFLAAVPMGASFCQFVLKEGEFLTSNSCDDDRLNGHPYKGVMVAYHGVPIPGPDGSLFGTLCHFDVREQPLKDAEFAYLHSVARVLPPLLK